MAIVNNTKPKSSVIPTKPNFDDNILFTFQEFKFNSIDIRGKFNNHYKDENDIKEKLLNFMLFSLPWFSNEKLSNLEKNKGLRNKFHFHKIENEQLDIIKEILETYGFPTLRIESLIDGDNIYQFSPELRSSPRIITERVDNKFSVLFWDTNHHIYFNEKLVNENNSLFYEVCPTYNDGKCSYMNGFCYAFDYLDIKKIRDTLSYDLSPTGLITNVGE